MACDPIVCGPWGLPVVAVVTFLAISAEVAALMAVAALWARIRGR